MEYAAALALISLLVHSGVVGYLARQIGKSNSERDAVSRKFASVLADKSKEYNELLGNYVDLAEMGQESTQELARAVSILNRFRDENTGG